MKVRVKTVPGSPPGYALDYNESRRYVSDMDFSGFIMIPVAAVITACWIIGAAALSAKGPGFRSPFLLAYALGVAFMEPWRIAAWQEFGMFVVMLIALAISVAAGCIIGGVPAAIAVSIITKLRQRFGR